jgi:hypothetical protein
MHSVGSWHKKGLNFDKKGLTFEKSLTRLEVKALRFLDPVECANWARERAIVVDAKAGNAAPPGHITLHCELPHEGYRLFALSRLVASGITHRQPCLLWVTESDAWPSNVNWQLYYKVRQTYGDYRLLDEAPGHLCLDYEGSDLATWLQLSFLFGWSAFILPESGYVMGHLSADEGLDLYSKLDSEIEDLQKRLEKFKVRRLLPK